MAIQSSGLAGRGEIGSRSFLNADAKWIVVEQALSFAFRPRAVCQSGCGEWPFLGLSCPEGRLFNVSGVRRLPVKTFDFTGLRGFSRRSGGRMG